MNRATGITIKKTLPFTTKQFLSLKNRVKSNFASKEIYRYGDQVTQPRPSAIQRSMSQAPSSLESESYLTYQKRRAQSIGPMLKIKKPNFYEGFRSKEKQNNVKIQKFNLQRFRKIIHLNEQYICRTCEIDKRFHPKLFKKRL